jgi:hypothetical protein
VPSFVVIKAEVGDRVMFPARTMLHGTVIPPQAGVRRSLCVYYSRERKSRGVDDPDYGPMAVAQLEALCRSHLGMIGQECFSALKADAKSIGQRYRDHLELVVRAARADGQIAF